jgi:hypothetical protein
VVTVVVVVEVVLETEWLIVHEGPPIHWPVLV